MWRRASALLLRRPKSCAIPANLHTWRTHRTPWKSPREELSVAHDRNPVHQHVSHSDRILSRPFVGRPVRDRAGIEHRDVGIRADADPALAVHLRHALLEPLGR